MGLNELKSLLPSLVARVSKKMVFGEALKHTFEQFFNNQLLKVKLFRLLPMPEQSFPPKRTDPLATLKQVQEETLRERASNTTVVFQRVCCTLDANRTYCYAICNRGGAPTEPGALLVYSFDRAGKIEQGQELWFAPDGRIVGRSGNSSWSAAEIQRLFSQSIKDDLTREASKDKSRADRAMAVISGLFRGESGINRCPTGLVSNHWL